MDAQTNHGAEKRPRVEDDRLVRGNGRYAADAPLPRQAHGYFLRSPHAFADIRAIDVSAAKAAPGVIAVLTAADITAAGVGNISQHPPLVGRGGKKLVMPHRPALAGERAMHVGEPVVLVVAETLHAAQDAAELVTIDYAEHDPAIGLKEATQAGAPQLWPDAPDNIAIDWPGPAPDPDANAAEVERIIASAKHVARVEVVHQRIVVASMEPRGATENYDAATDTYTLDACSQSARALRDGVAPILGVAKERLRVTTEDVGGAFGLKTGPYSEYLAILVAAKLTARPVHWMSTRSESFLSDNHARDGISAAELALDEKGKFLALRVRHLANMGAFIGAVGANIQTLNYTRCFPAMYDIRAIDVTVRCVFTNTVQTGPYRGAGRPEANYVLERVVDEAARITGIDPIKLRRRNLTPAKAMPYKTQVGTTIDSGDFATILDQALALSDYDGFKQRRSEAKKRGKHRGLGVSCMLEHAGGMPVEATALTFPGGQSLVLGLNVQSTGQGHATVFPPMVAERLGIATEQVQHRHGDSAMEIAGYASVGSRSAMTVSHALVKTVEATVNKGKSIAALLLEASESDIGYRAGHFEVVGTDRRISLFDLAARAAEMAKRGEIPESLDTRVTTETPLTFPNGCHIAEVEIDPATGALSIARYTAVDDCGTVLNHMIVEGQVHGSMAQGLGQALLEHAVYDTASGQLVAGSFMDYAMPRAEDMPVEFRDGIHSVPATTNPLGVKGAGEAGTTAAIAAVMNAISDAIPGGHKLDMPATPEKLWRACQEAARAS